MKSVSFKEIVGIKKFVQEEPRDSDFTLFLIPERLERILRYNPQIVKGELSFSALTYNPPNGLSCGLDTCIHPDGSQTHRSVSIYYPNPTLFLGYRNEKRLLWPMFSMSRGDMPYMLYPQDFVDTRRRISNRAVPAISLNITTGSLSEIKEHFGSRRLDEFLPVVDRYASLCLKTRD